MNYKDLGIECKHETFCSVCDNVIETDQPIEHVEFNGKLYIYHVACIQHKVNDYLERQEGEAEDE
jgi:hypothetical protein